MAITLPSAPIRPAASSTEIPDAVGVTDRIITDSATAADAMPDFGLNAIGENPWDVQQREADDAEQAFRRDSFKVIDGMALEPEKAFKDQDFSYAVDAEKEKRMVLNSAFMEMHLGGAPMSYEETDMKRTLDRQHVAQELFDGRGAESEEAFHAEVVKDATKRRDKRDKQAAIIAAAHDDFLLPEGSQPGFSAVRAGIKTLPGYDKAEDFEDYELFAKAREGFADKLEPIKEPLNVAWNAAIKGEGISRDVLFSVPDDQWPDFLNALRLRAQTLPDKERETFLAGMRKDFQRSLEGFGRNAADVIAEGGMAMEPTDGMPLPGDLQEWRKDTLGAMKKGKNRAAEARRILNAEYDPIDYVEGWGWLQKAPGVTATSLTMAVPYVGQATMAASMMGAAQESTYLRLRDAGKSEADAGQISDALAPAIMLPQMALERIGYGAWGRKIPWMSDAIEAVGNRITNRAARLLVKGGIITGVEGSTEVMQDFTEFAVQDMAAAFSPHVPDVDLGKEFKGAWREFPEIAGSMVFLSLFGAAGGLNAEARAAAWAAATPRQQAAAGLSPESIANIEAAKAKGPSSLLAAVDEAWATRNPDSPEAAAAAKEEAAAVRAQQQAAADLENLGYAPPRFVQTGEGITVFDSQTGDELGSAPDLSGAVRIAKAHTAALDDMEADQVAALGTLMEAARAATELDPQSAVDVRFGETFDPEKADPATAARFAAQVALIEQAEGGTGDVARSVLGNSETTFAQGLRTTVNRIFRGGSVLTVFHETFHGLRRQARAAGTITRADEIALLRGLDRILAGKRVKGGRELRFIPDGMADDQVSETLLDEAISEIAEMEVLRTRKGAGKGKLGVSRGVVSRNLSALAKLMPGVAGKFSAFLRAVRAHWGLSLSRAVALKSAERKGEFDAGDYDAFLNKLLGLDAQQEHDDGVRAELNRIMGMEDNAADDDIPFSIGGANAMGFDKAKDAGRTFIGNDGKERFEMDSSKAMLKPAIRILNKGSFEPREIAQVAYRQHAKGDLWDLMLVPPSPKKTQDIVGLYGIPEDVVAGVLPDDVFARIKSGEGSETVVGPMLYEGREFPAKFQFEGMNALPLDVVLDFPELFASYPDAAEIMVTVDPKAGLGGSYYVLEDGERVISLSRGGQFSTLLHEIQHWIQEKEGFAKGGSPDREGMMFRDEILRMGLAEPSVDQLTEVGFRRYKELPGEIEARGVQARASMTAEERAASPFMDGWGGFSLGPADVPGILAGDALSRIRDPRRRTQVMSRIARDFENIRLQLDRLLALSGRRRSKAELRQEANAREDLRAEELIADVHRRFGAIMADDDLVKIKSQPVHAYLSDPTTPLRGRLMSKAAAIKAHPERYALHRAGEYDGSDGVSRSVFGGQRMPDQAAQELYDAGLISEPTPDAMWEALLSEQQTVAKMKEFLAQATEQIREAKREAKRDATEWLNTQAKDQETNYNPREEIMRSLRMLDAILLALPPEIRGKIGGYTQIARITTDEAKLSFLKDRLAKADKELEIWLRAEFHKEWLDLLDRAKPDKDNPGQRPIGVIDADALDILRTAEAAMGLSFSQGEAKADALDKEAEDEATKPADAEKLRATAQMVRLTANWTAADAARREQAVIEGTRIYYGGLAALRVKQSARAARLRDLQSSAKRGTGKAGGRMERKNIHHKERGSRAGQVSRLVWEFLSFGQLVDTLFGEKSDAAKWFNSREIAASNAYEDGVQAKSDALETLLESLAGSRFGGEKLRHRMQTVSTISTTDALGEQHTFTDSEAITFLLMWRQEDGQRHMRGIIDDDGNLVSEWGWTDQSAAAVEAGLSPEARSVLAFLSASYGSEYGRINDVFRRIWNVSMPRHKMYAPLTVKPAMGKQDSIVDPVSGDTMGAGLTPGSLKNRSQTATAEPDFRDAFQVYLTHARQMEHFIAYGEFARDAMAVVNRREIRNSIEAVSPTAAATLGKWIDYYALGGLREAAAGGGWQQLFAGAISRLSSAALVGRVSVLAMQSLQLGASAYKMPLGAYLSRFARLLAGRLSWGDAIGSDYIQRRMKEMPPIVRDAVMGLSAGTPNRLKFYATTAARTIPGADGLFTAGTYAILYDFHLTQAKKAGFPDPEKHAHREAERITDQVAQPVRTGARSWLEVSSQNQPAFRALWNFASDPRQKMALIVYGALRHDVSSAEKAAAIIKAAAVTWAVSGILQAVLRSVLRDLRSDDDDEVFDERHWDLKKLGLMASTGPIGGIPYLGEMMESSLYGVSGEYVSAGNLFAAVPQGTMAAKRLLTGDWDDVMKDIESVLNGGAVASGTSAAATNAMHAVRDAVNIIENFTD